MDVLSEFQKAIEIEGQKKIEEFEEQRNQPLDERIAKGITMANLTVKFDFYNIENGENILGKNGIIKTAFIDCDVNISKFKEGTPVVLSNGNYSFQLEIEEDSVDNFSLSISAFDRENNLMSFQIDKDNYPKSNWEVNSLKKDLTTGLLQKSLFFLKSNNEACQNIERILNGNANNSYKGDIQRIDSLNDSQNLAFQNAIDVSEICIIQGPPGTGKTETIGHIAKHFIDCGLKVLITAPTHTAINNCLNSISNKVKDASKLIKIGEKSSNKEIQDNSFIIRKSSLSKGAYLANTDYCQQGIAIGATAYSPVSSRLKNWEFDIVIVDEASQLSIPLSIAAMCKAKKYIFVGDHKQLDPIIPKNSNNEMFAESIFGRLARIYPNEINLLNTSYRLNESLIKVPNTLFYNNLLHSDSTTKQDNAQYQSNSHSQILNNDSHTLVLHNVFDGNQRSPFEAKTVADLISDLLQNGVSLKDIGVMSPYRAQVREVKKEIKKNLYNFISNPFDSLLVDTVDSMQGQERDYIIYTMANTHPLDALVRLDFFYNPNRLNVAITRAIKKCIVIANYKVFDIIDEELQNHSEYQEIKDSLDIFKKYYSLSSKVEINETDKDEW